MNILLVNHKVPDANVFIESVNKKTRAILYQDTDLLSALESGPIEHLGIVFIKGMTFMGRPFEDQVELFNTTIARLQIKRIDFLACETLPYWKDFYAKLNTTVGASSDRTGNLNYGGNWVMESTGQDIEQVYFTKSIEYYKYLLDMGYHIFAVKEDVLYGYGSNLYSQLGSPIYNNIQTVTPIPFSITLVPGAKVVCGRENTFLMNNGILYGCGANIANQLGSSVLDSNDLLTSLTPITIPTGTLTDVICRQRNVAIIVSGKVYSMGYISGQPASFTQKSGLEGKVVTQMAFGQDFQVAVAGGELYGQGNGGLGQLGQETYLENWTKIPLPVTGTVTNVACGEYYTMVIIGGVLYGMGSNGQNQLGYEVNTGDENRTLTVIKYLGVDTSGVTHVAAFGTSTLIVMNNLLYGTGTNPYESIGPGGDKITLTLISLPSGATGPIQRIEMGETHMVAQINNVLYSAGNTDITTLSSQQIGTVKLGGVNTTNVTSIAAGTEISVAIIGNLLYGWGRNQYAQLGKDPNIEFKQFKPISIDGVPITGVTKTSAGSEFSMIIKGGVAYGSGHNLFDGRIGFNNNPRIINQFTPINFPVGASGTVTHVSCGQDTSVIVRNNKVYTTGGYTRVFTERALPAGVTGTIEAISTGFGHTLLLIGGKLYGYGINDHNRIGGEPGNTAEYTSIKSVENSTFTIPVGSKVTHIATTDSCSFFVMDNKIYGMGRNDYRMLSDSTVSSVNTITQIPFPDNVPVSTPVDKIYGGQAHFVAIIGGIAYGRGQNLYEQLGNQSGLDLEYDYIVPKLLPIRFNDLTFTSGVTNVICTFDSTYLFISNTINRVKGAGLIPLLTGVDSTSIVFGSITGSTTLATLTGTTGTVLTMSGELLNNILTVFIQDVSGCTIASQTATSISFVIPAGSGVRSLKFTDKSSNTYTYPTPFAYRNPIVVSSLSSNTGTKNKILTINATDMTNLARVKFNGVATTSFSQISPTQYSVIVPDSTTGPFVLEDIFNIASIPITFTYQNSTLVNGYINAERLSTSPTLTGKVGDRLTLVGTFLSETKQVYFGNTQATIIGTPTAENVVVTVPVEIGTVNIRAYDSNLNMTTCGKQFLYQLDAIVQGSIASQVISSTIDASGQKYYSILKNGRYYIGKYVNIVTEPILLYDNGVQPIRGIACWETTIYFCDPSNNRIQSIPTSITTVATPVLTRPTMVPEAIKTNGTKLWIVCKNTNDSTKDAIVIKDGSTVTVQTYALFAGFSLQGIAYNPSPTDTSLYVSAVAYPTSSIDTDRIFKTNATGGSPNLTFIQGLTNPIDLTFANGYLIVDGIIRIYDIYGNLIAILNTSANSIITEVFFSQPSVSFTSVDSVQNTTVVKQLPIPPNVGTQFQLTQTYTPVGGPEGTIVSIVGYNMTAGNISSIKIRDASNNLRDPYSYNVTSNLLVIRMPDPALLSSSVVQIVVTLASTTQLYDYTYQFSNLINLIPLFKNKMKYYRFIGTNLQNIQYVDFVDVSTNVLSENKIPVTNVTETSFDGSFISIPMNATRCLLQDAFGNVTIEDANYFSLLSETCFLGGTPVLTDQGEVPIDKIDPTYHTLDHQTIRAITKTRYNKDTLLLLEKDSLKKNYPVRDTVITHKHKIYYKGKMKRAESFLGKKGVRSIPYKNQFLYNVLLHTHEVMRVNGLICETLYPKNPIAKFFNGDNKIEE